MMRTTIIISSPTHVSLSHHELSFVPWSPVARGNDPMNAMQNIQ